MKKWVKINNRYYNVDLIAQIFSYDSEHNGWHVSIDTGINDFHESCKDENEAKSFVQAVIYR